MLGSPRRVRSPPCLQYSRWCKRVNARERAHGLYLWHFLALTLDINSVSSLPLGLRMGVAVVAAVVLAILSHTVVERPVLRRTAVMTRVRPNAVPTA